MPIIKHRYECAICGCSYSTEEQARTCENYGRMLQSKGILSDDNFPSWHWYRFTWKTSSLLTHIESRFIYKVSKRMAKSCLNSPYLELYNYSSNDYYTTENINIVEVLSATDMYKKYGKVMVPYFINGSNRSLMTRNGMPESVKNEIYDTYNLLRKRKLNEWMQNHSKEQLANMLFDRVYPECCVQY